MRKRCAPCWRKERMSIRRGWAGSEICWGQPSDNTHVGFLGIGHVYHPMIDPPGIKHVRVILARQQVKNFLNSSRKYTSVSSLFPNKSRQLYQKPRNIPRNNIVHGRSRMKMVIPNTPSLLRSVLRRKSVRCRITEDAGEGVV